MNTEVSCGRELVSLSSAQRQSDTQPAEPEIYSFRGDGCSCSVLCFSDVNLSPVSIYDHVTYETYGAFCMKKKKQCA